MKIRVTGVLERARQEEWPIEWRIRVRWAVPTSLKGLVGKRVLLQTGETPLPWMENSRTVVIDGRLVFDSEDAQAVIKPSRVSLPSKHAKPVRSSLERGGPDDR